MTAPSPFISDIIVLVLGACVGSFLNVCIYRIPEGRSIIWPGSACPSCGHRLSWWENLPILGYLILVGRCRECRARIPPQYPLVEVLTALTALALWRHFGPGWELAAFAYFASCLIVAAFIDLKHRIIPDLITLPGIAAGLLASCFLTQVTCLESLAGIISGGGVFFLVAWGYECLTDREGIGGGDIKLLAMIGAFLGWKSIPLVIMVSAGLGSTIGIASILMGKGDKHSAIPFGPFLSIAALLALLRGREIMTWYLRILSGG